MTTRTTGITTVSISISVRAFGFEMDEIMGEEVGWKNLDVGRGGDGEDESKD